MIGLGKKSLSDTSYVRGALQTVTTTQIKAALVLLDWTQGELAERSKLGYSTVADYLRGGRQHTWDSTKTKIQKCLEKNGIEFIPNGVKLHN